MEWWKFLTKPDVYYIVLKDKLYLNMEQVIICQGYLR